MKDWNIKPETAQNAIYLKEDNGGKGRFFRARFLQPGLVKYSFGVCLLTKETIDKFVYKFVGCPVVIDHKDVSDKNAKDIRVGVISKVDFEQFDGWYWCEGVIFDQEAIDLVNNGYNVSCQYEITQYATNDRKELHNGNPYDKEILDGAPEHLAIVKNPRYESAMIAVNAIDLTASNDKWITVHPNGEDEEGRPLLIKEGEDVKDAMQRQWGVGDGQLTLDIKGAKEAKKDARTHENKKQAAKEKLFRAWDTPLWNEDHKKAIEKAKEALKEYNKYHEEKLGLDDLDDFAEEYEDKKAEEKNKAQVGEYNKKNREAEEAKKKEQTYYEPDMEETYTKAYEDSISKDFDDFMKAQKEKKEESKDKYIGKKFYVMDREEEIVEYMPQFDMYRGKNPDGLNWGAKLYTKEELEKYYLPKGYDFDADKEKRETDKLQKELKEKTAKEEKEKKEKEYNRDNGFTEGKTDLQKGKILKDLNREVWINQINNGKPTTAKKMIEEMVEKGFKPTKDTFRTTRKVNGERIDKDTTKKILIDKDGRFYEVNKTEFDYANYLIDKNKSNKASNSFIEQFKDTLYIVLAEGIANRLGEFIAQNKNSTEKWITIKGNHILLKDGESIADAFKRTTGASLSKGNKYEPKDSHSASESYTKILDRVREDNKKEISREEIITSAIKNLGLNENEVRLKIELAEKYNEGIKDRGLETQKLHSNSNGTYKREREEKHEKILDGIFKDSERAKPKNGEKPTVIFLGGRGGSGKSKFNGLVYDEKNYIVLDADEIKKQIEEYRGYNAFEVHEESSDILNRAIKIARRKGLNIVLDATMKTLSSTEKKIKSFANDGYNVEMYYMHLPREKAAERAIGRFMGNNGRYVPLDILLSMKDNEENFDKLKKYASKWAFYNNDVAKKSDEPILIDKSK